MLHNEASQDSLDPSNFVTVDIAANPEMFVGNTADPSSAIQYHVTMADGDEAETGNYQLCKHLITFFNKFVPKLLGNCSNCNIIKIYFALLLKFICIFLQFC